MKKIVISLIVFVLLIGWSGSTKAHFHGPIIFPGPNPEGIEFLAGLAVGGASP